MATTFSRTMRSLESGRGMGFMFGLGTGLVFLLTWAVWGFTARVTVYEVTTEARLEVSSAASPLHTQVSGRVVRTHLSVGQRVREGDVLVELDDSDFELARQTEATRLVSLKGQVDAARRELDAEERTLATARLEAQVRLGQARARHQELLAAAKQADVEVRQAVGLVQGGHTSSAEVQRLEASAEQGRAAGEAQRLELSRLEWQARTNEGERQAQLERLRRALLQLEEESSTREAALRQHALDAARRRIHAPRSGRLGEALRLQPGTYVQAGDRIGVIIPEGPLTVIADFPATAQGRLREGQQGQLRLEGFSWLQYGSLPATVLWTAGETRGGRLSAELSIHPPPGWSVPLEHGLPGRLEVGVEQLTPVTLLLRSVGQLLSSGGTPGEPQPSAS